MELIWPRCRGGDPFRAVFENSAALTLRKPFRMAAVDGNLSSVGMVNGSS